MGFVVLHIQKAKGNDAGTSAHIERTIHPQNADESRTHLNRELVDFPEGVENRTQAIQHRIETAGITRKIKTDQVRAMRIMLSGSPDEMQKVKEAGRLDEWCNDNLDWLKQTFGSENLVSASLHLDEKTPHIHATVVPIVSGERRKAKQEQSTTKKKYKTKKSGSARLCADDVMARDKLKAYQESYAQRMQKYGLQRGIEGSEAKHISTPQYYRELFVQKEELKEYVEILQDQKVEINEKILDLYDRKDEARDKFLSMDDYVKQKEKELTVLETKLAQAKQNFEPYKAQEDLNFLTELMPKLKEYLRISEFCKEIGFGIKQIKEMLVKAIHVTGELFSPEHKKRFNVVEAKVKIDKEPDNPNKLQLNINGMNIMDWFRQKQNELLQSSRFRQRPIQDKNPGMKIG